MDRWWSDHDRATHILGSVDSSDVSQGVASAVLGLHALNAAALAPLASTTLVDRATVTSRLRQVDLAPVAEAVSRATSTVMGPAAGPYGQLVAKAWQDDAVEAADKMLTRWTSQGMAWPTAVQRLTSVVGLPTSAVGKALTALQAPAIPELVVKDMGDRALLRHASRVAAREQRGAVSKMSAYERAEFEREHPRDSLGRFRDKPDEVESTSQRRERMRDKVRSLRMMRNQRQQAQARIAQANTTERQEVSWGLLGLLPGAPAPAERQAATRSGRSTQRRTGRDTGRRTQRSAATTTENEAYALLPARDQDSTYALDQESYVILTAEDAVALINGTTKDMRFNGAGLRDIAGLAAMALDAPHVQGEINNLAGMIPDRELVILKLRGAAAIDDTNYGVTLADSGEYKVDMSFADIDPSSQTLGMEFDSGYYMPTNRNPARAVSQGRPIRMITADLINADAFPSQTRNLPYDRFGNLEKALTGYELEMFNRLHPRDEEGQFTERQGASAPPGDLAEMRARREKRRDTVRDRRRRVRERRQASQEQATVQAMPLAEAATQTETPSARQDSPSRAATRRGRSTARRTGRRVDRGRVRSALATQEENRQQKFDFARATGWVMSNQALADLAGLDIDSNWVGAEDGEGVRAPVLADDIPLLSGPAALQRLAGVWRKGVEIRSTVRVDGGPFVNELDAQAVADDFIATMDIEDYDEDVVPRSFAESKSVGDGEVVWYPRVAMVRDYTLSEPVVIFGEPASMAAMTKPDSDINPDGLKLIYSGTLDGLLKLSATDESLSAIPSDEPRSNGFVRAFWYQHEG